MSFSASTIMFWVAALFLMFAFFLIAPVERFEKKLHRIDRVPGNGCISETSNGTLYKRDGICKGESLSWTVTGLGVRV